MKIALNGTKVRAFKGVKNNRPYEFAVVSGHTEDGKTARAVFNNRGLYSAIASEATILDTVEVAADRVRERTFTGRDGKTVTTVEVTDPMPTGIERSTFPTKYPWPDWETLMKEAAAPASADAPAAEDSEAEF